MNYQYYLQIFRPNQRFHVLPALATARSFIILCIHRALFHSRVAQQFAGSTKTLRFNSLLCMRLRIIVLFFLSDFKSSALILCNTGYSLRLLFRFLVELRFWSVVHKVRQKIMLKIVDCKRNTIYLSRLEKILIDALLPGSNRSNRNQRAESIKERTGNWEADDSKEPESDIHDQRL